MIRSMTGFAEKSFNSSNLRVKIFIKTLNHRFLIGYLRDLVWVS